MKKLLALTLAMLLLFSLAGCAAEEASVGNQAELNALKAQLAELQNKPAGKSVHAINATLDGQKIVTVTQETSLTAQAVIPEGMALDHWELNGTVQENAKDPSFSFTTSGDAVVAAVLRAEKKVTTVNCKIQFLNDQGKAAGDKLEEFVFEDPYTNPVTEEEVTDGTISMQVAAEIPNGYVLDYWKINGVEYHPGYSLNSFIVKNLDEATEYEAVLKEKPITYYKVTCRNCTVNGKTETWVAAGTTVVAVANYSSEFVINGVLQNSKFSDAPYVSRWTFTVNSNTTVEAYAIIN